MPLQLALVMPVYNEEACIAAVVRSWRRMLGDLGIDFRMIVLNDGSTDATARQLEAFAHDPRVSVINKPNSGHGPTILQGYYSAVESADWVFQCDSDDEMKPDGFPLLWENRHHYDALFGVRSGRQQNPGRRLISRCSRLTVRLLFGRGVTDVNTPYRLIRSCYLGPIIAQIPNDTFAPNVIISGALARAGVRILNLPIPHSGRRTGTVSIVKWKLLRAATGSFWQTLRCRPSIVAAVDHEIGPRLTTAPQATARRPEPVLGSGYSHSE